MVLMVVSLITGYSLCYPSQWSFKLIQRIEGWQDKKDKGIKGEKEKDIMKNYIKKEKEGKWEKGTMRKREICGMGIMIDGQDKTMKGYKERSILMHQRDMYIMYSFF